MDWIIQNSDTLVSIIFGVLSVASLITGLTPTPKDDQFVRKLINFFSFLKPKDSDGTFKRPLGK